MPSCGEISVHTCCFTPAAVLAVAGGLSKTKQHVDASTEAMASRNERRHPVAKLSQLVFVFFQRTRHRCLLARLLIFNPDTWAPIVIPSRVAGHFV